MDGASGLSNRSKLDPVLLVYTNGTLHSEVFSSKKLLLSKDAQLGTGLSYRYITNTGGIKSALFWGMDAACKRPRKAFRGLGNVH